MFDSLFQVLATGDDGDLAAMIMGAVVLAASAIAVIAIGLKQRSGTLERNHTVGIRTKRTLADDDAWRIMHETASSWVVATGVPLLLVSPLPLLLRDQPDLGAGLVIAGCAVSMGLLCYGAWLGNRAISAHDAAKAAERLERDEGTEQAEPEESTGR